MYLQFYAAADLEATEERGEMKSADSTKVSARAKERGVPQLGTLGSGNHFLEVALVDKIFEPDIARAMGIDAIDQVMLYVHCGSRGLGHQVADDYVKQMVAAMAKYGIELPDRQLACAPVSSPEGQAYLGAMRCQEWKQQARNIRGGGRMGLESNYTGMLVERNIWSR